MSSGMSEKRLGNIDQYLQKLVSAGELPGVGALVFRNGAEAYCRSFGMQDIEKSIPMSDSSIYRIYSMSKTFTAVMLMTLYEKGLFKLHDPVGLYLPAFKEMQVAVQNAGDRMDLVAATRPITIHHLLTMTSGIAYPGDASEPARLMAEMSRSSVSDAMAGKPWNTKRMIDACASVPLCFHPGESYLYGFSHDVLGRLIEVLSDMKLSEYLAETICKPLNLVDTSFYVEPDRQCRLVTPYAYNEGNNVPMTGLLIDPAVPSPFESGGGGLASTLRDVGRFGQMLLNNGMLDGERILSRKTVELMRINHLSPAQTADFNMPAMVGYGYGLGVRTLLDPVAAGLNGSVGEWAWDGMLGTWYAIDPAENLVAVFLMQRGPGGNDDFPKRFAQIVYGAIDD